MNADELVIPNDFSERGYQAPIMEYLDTHPLGGRAVWVLHRRAGKDLTLMHQTCKMMVERVGTYWHIYPTAEQARRAIWTGFTRDGKRIMEQVFPEWLRKSPRSFAPNSEMMVELKNGAIWRLMGSDKMEVVGAGPVGVVFSEFALSRPRTWDLVRPMLRESNGWAAFISTPRGRNHLWDVWETAGREGWFRDLKTVHDTGQKYASTRKPGTLITPDEMMAEERAEGMEDAMVRQEYLCDWTAANVGSVWGEQIEALEKRGSICEFEHPHDGVFVSWDLGISDAMALWFWRVNADRAPDLIDHYESTGKPISHYLDECEARGYGIVKHLLPHDAKARSYQTGASTIELVAKRVGQDRVGLTPELSLADGIQAARWLLQQPIRIHSRCGEGIEALKAYHYAFDEDAKTMSRLPEHDWSSHSADAFRYVACAAKAGELLTRPEQPEIEEYARSLGSVTFDELVRERRRRRG